MNLRTRMIGLIGLFLALLLTIGVWGVRATIAMQDRILAEHERISEVELNLLTTAVSVQRQIEGWQDVLLRGHDLAELETHWAKFVAEEKLARTQMQRTLELLPPESVSAGLVAKFLRDHRDLGESYRDALVVFKVGGEGAQLRGDGLMRGRSEQAMSILTEVSRIEKEERRIMEGSLQELSLKRSIMMMLAIVLTSLTAFVVLAVAMHHWMGLSILSAGRTEEGAVSYKVPKKAGDEKVTLAPSVWKRVAVAIADPSEREKLARELKGWNCEVVEVESASGLARVLDLDGQSSGAPAMDLVVASDDLPGVGGIALGRLLKSEASTREIPLVLQHANGGPSGAEAKTFFADVVSRTLDAGVLKKRLMKLLESPPTGLADGGAGLDLQREFPLARGVRVLAAEDEPLNRKYLALMLNKVGFEHALVENGQLALEAMEEVDYGVLLMDCGMPVMDGFEATRRIRENAPAGEGPVVIGVTARTDDEAREKCRTVGMNACVAKPLKLEYLCLVIEEELAKREEGQVR